MSARRPAYLLLLLLVLGTATGCGGLPIPGGSSSVRAITDPNTVTDADPVRRIPFGPGAGASPAEIVSGFLSSGADINVAKDYLTSDNPWDPSATTVFTGQPTVAVTNLTGTTATATASLTPVLTIAADGMTVPGGESPGLIRLTRENGEWRISSIPDTVDLRDIDLAASYARGTVAWLSPDRTRLVRESVLLPGTAGNLAPDVLGALLAGPPARLRQAGVGTAIPSTLSVVAVRQQGSESDVTLASSGSPLDSNTFAGIRAQLAATLLPVPGITSVRVDIAGQPVFGGGASPAITAADVVGFDPGRALDVAGDASGGTGGAYLATDSAIARLDPGAGPLRTAPAGSGSASPTGSATPTGPAGSANPRTGSSGASSPGASGTSTATPSTATPSTATPSTAIPSPAAPGTTRTPQLTAGRLRALAVTADGQRAAELLRETGGLQPVLLSLPLGTSTQLAPAGAWSSISWGADDDLWLTTTDGNIFVSVAGHAPVAVTSSSRLTQLVVASDGVHAIGISTDGTLVGGLVTDVLDGSMAPAFLDSHQLAPALGMVTAVTITGDSGSGGGDGASGLQLLVAATRTVASTVSTDTAATPGVWSVSVGAPDPAQVTADDGGESLVQEPAACQGVSSTPAILALAGRPGSAPISSCSDGSVRVLVGQEWTTVAAGLAAYPIA